MTLPIDSYAVVDFSASYDFSRKLQRFTQMGDMPGTYSPAFMLAGVLCIVAAASFMLLKKRHLAIFHPVVS